MKDKSEFHPSFQVLLDRIPERGMYSRYAYVEWWPRHEPHGHTVMLGDGKTNSLLEGGSLEEAAEELVEAIERCNSDRHRGHGRTHTFSPNDVFPAALEQLQTSWYDREWVYHRWLQWMHEKWGGHMPAAVILPTEGEWKMLVPDEMGDPIQHNIRPEVVKQLGEVIPMPDSSNSEEAEFGSRTKKRWSPERRLRHLRKKGL
jgi:hypothetical protein